MDYIVSALPFLRSRRPSITTMMLGTCGISLAIAAMLTAILGSMPISVDTRRVLAHTLIYFSACVPVEGVRELHLRYLRTLLPTRSRLRDHSLSLEVILF